MRRRGISERETDSKYVWRALRTLCDENMELMGRVANEEGKVGLEKIVSEEVRVSDCWRTGCVLFKRYRGG